MNGPSASFPSRLSPNKVVILAAVAAIVAFAPSVLSGYVFDDHELVVKNPYAHDARYLGRCFTTDLWDTPARRAADPSPKFYRPVVCASFIVDHAIGRGSPFWYHLTNVVAHAATTALAARVLLRWTASPITALAAALLFAVHPARTENVVWISGRTDVLSTLFMLAALELVVSAGRRGRPARYAFGVASWVLALLSKELAVAFPVLLAIEWVLARSEEDPRARRRLGVSVAGFAIASLIYVAVRAHVLPFRAPESERLSYALLTQAGYGLLTLGYYVSRIAWPWPQTLYFRPVAFDGGVPVLSPSFVALGAAAALALAVAIFVLGRRDRVTGALVLAFGALLFPALNVVDTGIPTTTADRLLYLPLLPLSAALARSAGSALTRWTRTSRLAPVVSIAGVVLCSAVCWVRSLDYESDCSLFRRELDLEPNNPIALGRFAACRQSLGDPDAAVGLLSRALSPAALRFQLLASPTRYYLALLQLAGPRIPDGDALSLLSLTRELDTVLRGELPAQSPRTPTFDLPRPPPDPHFAAQALDAAPPLAVAAALVASRLPWDDAVRRFASLVPGDAPLDAAAHFNLALALGRAGSYDDAERELARARASDAVADAATALATSLRTVRSLREQAQALPEPASSIARARAFSELGAHLRAARVLHRAAREHPDDESVRTALFDAVVSARLDREALSIARTMPGPESPEERLSAARQRLAPSVKLLPAATDESALGPLPRE